MGMRVYVFDEVKSEYGISVAVSAGDMAGEASVEPDPGVLAASRSKPFVSGGGVPIEATAGGVLVGDITTVSVNTGPGVLSDCDEEASVAVTARVASSDDSVGAGVLSDCDTASSVAIAVGEAGGVNSGACVGASATILVGISRGVSVDLASGAPITISQPDKPHPR